MSTAPVPASWTIAATRPSAVRRRRAAIAGSSAETGPFTRSVAGTVSHSPARGTSVHEAVPVAHDPVTTRTGGVTGRGRDGTVVLRRAGEVLRPPSDRPAPRMAPPLERES